MILCNFSSALTKLTGVSYKGLFCFVLFYFKKRLSCFTIDIREPVRGFKWSIDTVGSYSVGTRRMVGVSADVGVPHCPQVRMAPSWAGAEPVMVPTASPTRALSLTKQTLNLILLPSMGKARFNIHTHT